MSHSGPVIPAFVDLSEAEQAAELLAFLKGLGAEVSGTPSGEPNYVMSLILAVLSLVKIDV